MKKVFSLALLLASSLHATVDWKAVVPVVGVLAAGEAVHQLRTHKTVRTADCGSCTYQTAATDVATATVGAAAMMVAKRHDVTDVKDFCVKSLVEGVKSYCSLKVSQSSMVTDACSAIPCLRGLTADHEDNSRMSATSLTRYTACYLICNVAIDAAINTVKALIVK